MKGQNRKLVISLFISIIAICYVSLAISYAWFFANRAQDNSANNLKIVDFNGDIFYYKDNYEYDENGEAKDYKGFQGDQTFNNSLSLTDKFVSGTGSIMTMPDMLPNVRFLYLVKLKHNYESSIQAHFFINSYESYLGVKNADGTLKDQSECPKDVERPNDSNDYDYISLSEAINIYIGGSALKLNDSASVTSLQDFVNKDDFTFERFHARDVDGRITTNIDTSMDTSKHGVPLLTSVDIPPSTETDEYYYVPIMFEFSNNKDTYYSSTKVNGKDGNFYTHNEKGNSNVYKNLTFEINEFEITPYSK